MQSSFGRRFCEFRNEKILSFPVSPFSIDPSELNMIALEGVSQPGFEIELANIADKDIWISKYRRLTADHKDVACQKANLAEGHNWSKIENLPKLDQLIFETWNALSNVYENTKKYALGILSILDPHTYVSNFSPT